MNTFPEIIFRNTFVNRYFFIGKRIQRLHQKLKDICDPKLIKNHWQKKKNFIKEGKTNNFNPLRGPVI